MNPLKTKAAALAVIGASLILAACHKAETPAVSARPVLVMTVGGDQQGSAQVYAGEVRARHEIDLSFRVGGKLIERKAGLGQTVKRGDVLARIDAQDIVLSNTAAKAGVDAAQADLDLLRKELEREQKLLAQKFISPSALDSRRGQIAAAEARLQQTQAQASVQGNSLGYTQLQAVRDGVITAAPVESGQVVAAGQTVFRLADPSEREILIWVPENRLAGIKTGMSAFVQSWNQQDKNFAGIVREVAASADPATRTYAVRISVAKPDATLPLGATAGVGFVDASAESAIVLPLPAVLREQGKTSVWVLDANDNLQSRPVEVSVWRDEVAVLSSGLKAGERVVVQGAHLLKPDMKVRAIAATSPVALDIKR